MIFRKPPSAGEIARNRELLAGFTVGKKALRRIAVRQNAEIERRAKLLREHGIKIFSHTLADASPQRFDELVGQRRAAKTERAAELERRRKLLENAGIKPTNSNYPWLLNELTEGRTAASIAAIRALGIKGSLDSLGHYFRLKPAGIPKKRKQITRQHKRATELAKPNAIVQLYLAGKTYGELQRELHISYRKVQAAISSHKFTAAELETIRANLKRRRVIAPVIAKITGKLNKKGPSFVPEFCAEHFETAVVSNEKLDQALKEGTATLKSGAILSKVTTLDHSGKITSIKIHAIVHTREGKPITLARWNVQQVV